MYWLTRYVAFISANLLVSFGELAWGDLSKCGAQCMFSGLDEIRLTSISKLIQFVHLTLLASTASFVLVALAFVIITAAVTWITEKTDWAETREASANNSQANSRSEKRGSWLRDYLFTATYLLISAAYLFWKSPNSSFSWNGRSIYLDGKLTEFGIRLYSSYFLICCSVAALFVILVRIAEFMRNKK